MSAAGPQRKMNRVKMGMSQIGGNHHTMKRAATDKSHKIHRTCKEVKNMSNEMVVAAAQGKHRLGRYLVLRFLPPAMGSPKERKGREINNERKDGRRRRKKLLSRAQLILNKIGKTCP